MNEDSKIWDEVHIDSAKYRAVQLIQMLLIQMLDRCVNVCREIRDNPETKPDDRMGAARTMCEAEANIFKLINEGPIFRTSLRLSFSNDSNKPLTN